MAARPRRGDWNARRSVLPWSAIVILAMAGAMPSPSRADWTSQDIGTVSAAGHGSLQGTTVSVTGSGSDIWVSADSFQFLAQQYTSDITFTARITGMTDTNGWAKAGLMIRESLDANSPNVFIAATPEWHGITAQQRATAGGSSTGVAGPGVTPTYWLRLTRSGTTITAATSPDGTTWSTVTTFTTTFGVAPYYGFAVTSHNDGVLCTATFDNVNVLAPAGTPAGTPTNLAASALSWSQIALSWRAPDTAVSWYEIERSADGVSFALLVAPSSAQTTYTDAGLAASTTYFYRVRAANSSGYSGYSNIASATTTALPAQQSADIGTTTAGQTTVSGDAVTLTGSGRDIWNTADGFRYYYQPTPSGDCEMIVRVASLQNTNGWAKAGIMFRESLDPGSRHAWVCVSAEHGTAFQWRATTGGDTQSTAPSEDGTAPRWLKLVFKAGPTDVPVPPTVLGYVSQNGVSWTQAGNWYLPYGSNWQYIGLAATSHNDGVLCTAQFDNLRFIAPPPAPTGLQVTHRGPGGEIDLAWTYTTSDVDRFEIQANPEKAGNHDWRTLATVPAGSRQAIVYNIDSIDGEVIRIAAFRDFVKSPWASWGYVRATATPALSVTGTTSTSIGLRVTEQFGYSGAQRGPWSIERSTDGVNFVEIVGGLTPTGGTSYSDWADYTDSGLPSGVTRYYRARQLLTNGDASGYSPVVSATTTSGSTVPVAPSGLVATVVSSSQIQLTWTDNATNETSYEVQRSTDGVNFGVTFGGLAANSASMTDTALSPSTTYYYRVRAVNASGGSPYSSVASATTTGTSSPPPSGSWQSGDVGAVAMTGSDSTSGSMVTVAGGGADIWGSADSFRFRYQALSGDGSITARVVSMTDTDGWAKAGVMIRNSLSSGARNVFACVTPEWHGLSAQVRSIDGGTTTGTAGPGANAPYWLRVTRAGTAFTVQSSPDGATWTTYASYNVTMDATVVVGLAVTSHNQNALCTATFDNVAITGGTSPGTPPAATWSFGDIGAVGVAGSNSASGSTITINGSGADIWGTADAFYYVWKPWSGDGVVEAHVNSMGNTNGWAKAGVMIRESAGAGARNVFVALTPTWHGIVAQARSTTDDVTTQTAGPLNNTPYWVRLARAGNTFTASTSPDGVTWTAFATFNLAMTSSAYFGFAVTAHDNTQLNQAVFSDPFFGVK